MDWLHIIVKVHVARGARLPHTDRTRRGLCRARGLYGFRLYRLCLQLCLNRLCSGGTLRTRAARLVAVGRGAARWRGFARDRLLSGSDRLNRRGLYCLNRLNLYRLGRWLDCHRRDALCLNRRTCRRVLNRAGHVHAGQLHLRAALVLIHAQRQYRLAKEIMQTQKPGTLSELFLL